MPRPSFRDVKNKCIDERFFAYEGINDRIFSGISIFLVWLFVRIKWSGNAVSLLSGCVAIFGGILMSSSNPWLIFTGSFGYLLFYLLDYVDGGVARINGQSGIGGQYVDWCMHVVSALGIGVGLLTGAILQVGFWVVPFGILTIISMALALDRYALGWFAICMHYQQQRVKGNSVPVQTKYTPQKVSFLVKLCRNTATLIFHESYLIYSLPIISLLQLLVPIKGIDFRVIFIIFGGVLYFPIVLLDILNMATSGKVDHAFNKLFHDKNEPKLPEDHYFGE